MPHETNERSFILISIINLPDQQVNFDNPA